MLPRPVEYRREFQADLRERLRWLAANRPPRQIDNLEEALVDFVRLVGANPGLGLEVAQRGGRTYRVFGLGKLPYLVWYFYAVEDPAAPVWLTMLLHEKQDRERFNPALFE